MLRTRRESFDFEANEYNWGISCCVCCMLSCYSNVRHVVSSWSNSLKMYGHDGLTPAYPVLKGNNGNSYERTF
ncbi:hypothetical protein Plhal304r1_c037g0112781 [Plasmopara halstedii]